MDEKDSKILELLRQNGKFTTQQIAGKVLMPVTTVHNRIKKMEERGIIKGYSVILDNKKLGKSILAFISIKVSNKPELNILLNELVNKVCEVNGVEEVYNVTGDTDIIAKIRVENTEELNEIVVNTIRNIKGVDTTSTSIVLSAPALAQPI